MSGPSTGWKSERPSLHGPGRTLRRGEYRIEGALSYGGAGRLFLASHVTLDTPLALKQLRGDRPLPESVAEELDFALTHRQGKPASPRQQDDFPLSGGSYTDRFVREALLLVRLRHPAMPMLYDYFFEDGYWYLVLEYCAGPTLASYLRQQGPLPPLEALSYAMQICDLFDYLHSQRPPVIYRGLRPASMILTSGGRLVFFDFGCACYLRNGQLYADFEPGVPGYAAPEQHQHGGQCDERSDLFSLGVLLHEMVTGQNPLGKNGHLEPVARLNPALSPALSALITIATRADPLYRFQSARAFFHALERIATLEERRAYQRLLRLHLSRGVTAGSSGSGSTSTAPVAITLKALAPGDAQSVFPSCSPEEFAAEPTVAIPTHQIKAASPCEQTAQMPALTPYAQERSLRPSQQFKRRPWRLVLFLILLALLLLGIFGLSLYLLGQLQSAPSWLGLRTS
ncbi:serine/threonine protein kinase [Thermogemmatispora sp.]|uniref:serine/threonine protein kinase n=1 Tax=Thermogemmatispora sp. TaxID=1968838 RepID=UPI001D54B323|nr:serine/threonine-protein kinase [Thermogemmatispora sp.]MBX5450329.1 serine/threonine protein kinase [Thermogemmatispora sp.]